MTIAPGLILLNLRIVGLIMAALVVVNLLVPKRFHWREELSRLSLVNRQIFEVHAIFIVVVLALFSILLLAAGDALLEPTHLSRMVLGGLAIFWGLRLLAQWFYYSPAVWRGDRFRTAMHCLFSAAWIYVTSVFGIALWSIR